MPVATLLGSPNPVHPGHSPAASKDAHLSGRAALGYRSSGLVSIRRLGLQSARWDTNTVIGPAVTIQVMRGTYLGLNTFFRKACILGLNCNCFTAESNAPNNGACDFKDMITQLLKDLLLNISLQLWVLLLSWYSPRAGLTEHPS